MVTMGLDRRSLLLAASGLAVAPAAAAQAPRRRGLPERGEYLIKGATIVSVDPQLGVLPRGDIHVRDGVIVAVAPEVRARGARVLDARGMTALPGFIDSHWHMWTGVFRAFVSPTMDYTAAKDKYARHYTPQDSSANIKFGLIEAIDAGVTGVLNFDHNVLSADHADAELMAHADCGVRTLFSYSAWWGIPDAEPMDLQGLQRTVAKWRNDPAVREGLLKLGAAPRGRRTPPAVYQAELDAITALGLPLAYHGGSGANIVLADDLLRRGYLKSDTVITHYIEARQQDRDAMRQAGASLSWSSMGEIRNSEARAQILQMAAAGVNISLSADATTISPLDMFENMRTLMRYSVPGVGDPRTAGLRPFTHAQVLQMATLNGARALGMEKITGSLTPGKRADLLLMRQGDLNMAEAGPDPIYSAVAYGRPQNVDTVMIDGRIMKRGGAVVGVDVPAIRAAAVRSTLELRRRAGG